MARQADELPRPLPALLDDAATPTATCRCATPSRGCCTATSPRASARAAARAPLRPGRRPHLLHRGAGPGGGARVPGDGFAIYELFDFEVRLELSTRPEQRIGDDELWDRAELKLTQALEETGPRLRAEPRRRRLLRAEDRHAHDRLARALLAARDGPARLLDARALRAQLHGRRQRRAPPVMIHRALFGSFERFIGILIEHYARRAAALAGAAAGDRAARLRPLQRVRRGGRRASCARRSCASSWTTDRSRWGARSATPSCARSRSCWSSASARRRTARCRCARTATATSARAPSARLR